MTSQLPSLELITFGVPVVRINGQEPPSDVEWRKHIALLSYLALSPDRTRTRTQIIGMLWPETTDRRARHSLNEAVRRLRGSLGSERIRSTGSGETLTLSAEHLTVDALEFDRVADSDRERALEYLRGDFLEGFSLPDSEAFEAWLSERRGHYRARGAALLIAGGDDALAALRYDQASELARRGIHRRGGERAGRNAEQTVARPGRAHPLRPVAPRLRSLRRPRPTTHRPAGFLPRGFFHY